MSRLFDATRRGNFSGGIIRDMFLFIGSVVLDISNAVYSKRVEDLSYVPKQSIGLSTFSLIIFLLLKLFINLNCMID